MLRLLIVDDEPIISDGLHELFSVKYSEQLEVLRVYSAQDAIQIFNRARVDIILSDIEMPGMDGISLMKQVRDRWPYCRIVFLTGHDRFNYAYNAISGGVSAYILKTEGDDKILAAVDRCIDEIVRENDNEEFMERMQARLDESRILVQRETMLNFLKGYTETVASVSKFENLGIPITVNLPCVLVCGRVNNLPGKHGVAEKQASIQTLFYQYTRTIGPAFLFFENDSRFLYGILQPISIIRDVANLISEALERMQETCVSVTNLEISFIVDDHEVLLEKLPERYAVLSPYSRYWLNEHQGAQLLLASYFTLRIDAGEAADIRSRASQTEILELLQNAVESTDQTGYEKVLEQMKKLLIGIDEQSLLRIEFLSSVISFLSSFINRRHLASLISRAERTALFSIFYKSPDEIYEFLHAFGYSIFSAVAGADLSKDESFVMNIHQYIQQHLSQSITLFQLGEYMHFNSAYMSRLYKQITGVNISEAILEIKMTSAKEIIRREPYLKVNEVAKQVGFDYPAYFARVFRKRFGVSPQEYRSTAV